MQQQLKSIRLDKINIPSETLRKSSSPAADLKLQESLKKHGVLVPLILREIGKGEYDVWDGTRRIKNLYEIGETGSKLVPAIIATGNDDDAVITQININQTRERLSDLAEAEGLRQLVQDHKWKQNEAAAFLLKTKSWASKIIKAYKLPKKMVNAMRNGKIALSHAIIISRYLENPNIMNLLFEKSLTGNITSARLAALGIKAEKYGIKEAKKIAPKRYTFGKKSWIRLEPLQSGVRAELHLEEIDNASLAIAKLKEILGKVK